MRTAIGAELSAGATLRDHWRWVCVDGILCSNRIGSRMGGMEGGLGVNL